MPTKKIKRGGLSKKKSLTNSVRKLKLMGVNQQTREVWLIAEVDNAEEAKTLITADRHTEYYLMDSYNQVYLLN
tara:strand:- start:199 stop:420 length:222 start_codon:yes stop_codon:yes gene_type:complete